MKALNLLPKEYSEKAALKKTLISAAIFLAVIFLLLILIVISAGITERVYREKLLEIGRQINGEKYTVSDQAARNVFSMQNSNSTMEDKLSKEVSGSERYLSVEILMLLSVITESISVVEITYDARNMEAVFSGYADTYEAIKEFEKAIRNMQLYTQISLLSVKGTENGTISFSYSFISADTAP